MPGACFAPTTGYLSVASRAIAAGEVPGDGRERFTRNLYDGVLPQPGVDPITGDGLVPTVSALLDGSRQLVLDDAVHAPARHAPWYGAESQLDRWWPVALETWRTALTARQVRARARDTADEALAEQASHERAVEVTGRALGARPRAPAARPLA